MTERWEEIGAPVHGYGRRIPWSVHCKAWEGYSLQFGTRQSAERIAERGGFDIGEMDIYFPNWREESDEIPLLRKRIADLERRLGIVRLSGGEPGEDGWHSTGRARQEIGVLIDDHDLASLDDDQLDTFAGCLDARDERIADLEAKLASARRDLSDLIDEMHRQSLLLKNGRRCFCGEAHIDRCAESCLRTHLVLKRLVQIERQRAEQDGGGDA